MRTYSAAWNKSTYFFTAVGLIGAALIASTGIGAGNVAVTFFLVSAMSAVPLLCWALAPRAYRIADSTVRIQRWVGAREIPLAVVQRARLIDPAELANCSWRFPVNGGLFGFFGRFHSPALGDHEWAATRDQDLVLLQTKTGPIVISPDTPSEFVAEVNRLVRAAG